jgi:hypothetical protein
MTRLLVAVFLLSACGFTQVKVEPVKVQPIHITVDVNLHDRDVTGDSTGDRK